MIIIYNVWQYQYFRIIFIVFKKEFREHTYPSLRAMLIQEYVQQLPARVQIFCSDIHETAIGHDRAGLYPDVIDLFIPIDKKWKIYKRQEGERPVDTHFPFAGPALRSAKARRPVFPSQAHDPAPLALAEKFLLDRYAPVRVIINEKHEVVNFSDHKLCFRQ